jgi:hypothetical protein
MIYQMKWKTYWPFYLIWLVSINVFSLVSYGQQASEEFYQKKGLFNLLESKVDSGKPKEPPKKIFSFMPIVSANPVVGVSFGIAFNESFCLGSYRDTKYSTVNFVPVYTTNKQYSFGLNNTVFTDKNRWRFNGGMNYIYFPQGTSGLGSRTPQSWTHLINPTTFKFQQTASFQFAHNFYFGLGVSYYNVSILEPEADHIAAKIADLQSNGALTYEDFQKGLTQSADFPVYVFDRAVAEPDIKSGFDPQLSAADIQSTYFRTPLQTYSIPRGIENKYNALGIQAELTLDSRDNINQAESGTYINLLYSYYPKIDPAISGDFGIVSLDLRKYIVLDASRRSFLNLWSWTSYAYGTTPYAMLPATGADPNAKSTAAYKTGGYRSDFIFTAQVEYRYYFAKFFAAGLYGTLHTLREQEDFIPYRNQGVAVGTQAYIDPGTKWQFQYWNPSIGPVVSIFLDKNSRTSMNFSYAFGVKADPGTYADVANKGFYMYMSASF